jgi:hypothetical protein
LHPTGIEGANQTIFVRRIALRPPIEYFKRPSFMTSRRPTALERFRATVASIKKDWGVVATVASTRQDWWVVEKPEDTQSLPAEASGASGSAGIKQPSDSEDNLVSLFKSYDVQRAP